MCGGHARFVKHSDGIRGTMGFDSWDAVSCACCGLTVGACDRRFREKDDAAKAWNTRMFSVAKNTSSYIAASVQAAAPSAIHEQNASMRKAPEKQG
jgi:hypothetical protein